MNPGQGRTINFYKHHLGDYMKRTLFFSMAQHGAYRLMSDYCYINEGPLPPNKDMIYEICKAKSKADKQAVETVLAAKWVLQEDGYHDDAVDEVIEKYHEKAGVNKANGIRGGRPKKTQSVSESEPTNNLSQNPESRIQNPEKARAEARASRLPSDWVLPEEWAIYAESQRHWSREQVLGVADGFRDWWVAKAGKDGRKLDWFATWRTWVRNQRMNGHGHSDSGLRAGDAERSAARRAILQPSGAQERDVTGDSERIN